MLLSVKQIGFRLALLSSFAMMAPSIQGQNKKPDFTKIQVTGYVRSNITFRNLSQNYVSGGSYTPKTFILNGVYPDNPLGNGFTTGYREPLAMFQFIGKPTANTDLNVDLLIDNQMTGQIFNSVVPQGTPNAYTFPRRIQSYRFLNFGGGINTDYGKFDFKAGGVIFYAMTPFTLWNNEFRDDMFERYPWEWQTNSMKRYNAFYADKNIARDSRWGSGTIQGYTLTGTALPFRTGLRFAYGKSNNSGGFQSYLSNNNQYVLSSQINKKFASHALAVTYYQSTALNDSVFDTSYRNVQRQNIITSELKLNYTGLTISSEFGAGSVSNAIDSIRNWDPLLSIKANASQEILPFPVSLQYYYIGPNVVNLTSAILNSSNRNVQAKFGQAQQYNTTTFEGIVTEFGQMTNNRQTVNLSGGLDVGNLKFVLALSSAQEIENRFNLITFQHRLNGINRSQFIFYRNQVGPYGRQLNQWRRSWEKLTITDTLTSYKKGFNLIDFSTKYKTRLFDRELIFSNYINYNSVQDKFAPLALFSNKAFLRSFYEEFMVFYNIMPQVTIVGLAGLERNFGNNRTDLAPNGKPIDQTGHGYGLGLDLDINATTGLYLRQRFYSFSDKNFTLDHFKGYDSNVELKIFF